MMASISEQSQACIDTLKTIVSILSDQNEQNGHVHHGQINDELERLPLWVGNIGALHRPDSPLSVESRLYEARDVLTHVLELLQDLNEVVREGLPTVYACRAAS